MADPEDKDWLLRSLKAAREEVARWPQWKKDAMRVLPKPASSTSREERPSGESSDQ